MYVAWTDGFLHSLNPFTCVFANPILDYLMKPVISHTLHHLLLTDYYLLNSLDHAVVKGSMKEDMKLYNKLLETNFS